MQSRILFKSSFILVRDIGQEVIFGTSFITQIYQFKVNQLGVHTEIIGTIILFKFITPVYQKYLSLLQNTSISRQINVIECDNPKYWYKLERLEVIKQLTNDQKELQEIDQQLEEISIILRNHITSRSPPDFNEFYIKWLNEHCQLMFQRHDMEKTIEYWKTNLRILNVCVVKYQII